ncbi:hypothetical protein Tco_1259086 [Tanacetum coccineum]
MWPKPGGLVYLLYVIKSSQSSMILPADHVSRAVISARLQLLNGFPGDPLPLINSTFHHCLLELQFALFPHPSFQMAKTVAKYSIMTQEMVDSFSEAFYIPVGVHPTALGRDKTIIQFLADIGLLDFIRTADPRKVRAVEVQKGADQVTLRESTKDCFMPLVIPAAGGSISAMAAEVPVPTEERQEDVAPEDAYLNLADPDEDAIAVRQGEEMVVSEQPKKVKRRRLVKQSDALPAKKLRTDHPSLASGTGGKTLANLDFGTLSAPVDTAAATTSTRPATASKAATDVGPSHPEELECSDDSFYEIPNVDPAMAKRWYVPKWKITNDSLLDDAFSCRTLVDRVAPPAFFSDLRTMVYDQLFIEFNVGEARQICLGSEVRSRAEHELELKEKLRAKYAARGRSWRSFRQPHVISGEKSTLTAEVSALKVTIAQKDHDISLLDSHSTSLASGLENAKVACTKVGDKIISLTSERDRLISEVSSLHAGFQDFKKKMEVQLEEQAQELCNRVAELEGHVMDVSGYLEGEFYPTYLTTLAGRRWLLAHAPSRL